MRKFEQIRSAENKSLVKFCILSKLYRFQNETSARPPLPPIICGKPLWMNNNHNTWQLNVTIIDNENNDENVEFKRIPLGNAQKNPIKKNVCKSTK